MRTNLGGTVLAALLVVGIASWANDEKSKENVVITNPDLGGLDFRLQGEYSGQSAPGAFGLQIVALGEGKFDAVVYNGGLPGAGWDRSTPKKMSGSANDDQLALDGDSFTAIVDGATGRLMTPSGDLITSLSRNQRVSPTMNLPPPDEAIALFHNGTMSNLAGGKLTADGDLAAGVLTDFVVGDFKMHIEFRTPFKPHARGQARGNSGVYIQQRYEVQILDSFGLEGVENECGGLYRQRRPAINMCLPPLSWQTYDITFVQARWNYDGTKRSNARITVLHNGIPIHSDQDITAKTGGGKIEGPDLRPILLQDHGNPVAYRNFWIQPLQIPEYMSIASLHLESLPSFASNACQPCAGQTQCLTTSSCAEGRHCNVLERLISRLRMRR